MQYRFYRHALQIYYGLHLPGTHKKLKRDCLKHHCERLLKLSDWSSTSSKFDSIDRRS